MMEINLSIVICTQNRCEILKRALDTLCQQNVHNDFTYEIIIVDNKSTDKTRDVVEQLMPQFNERLKYTFESNAGLSYARNKGIKESKGDVIAFTDDDCEVPCNWVESIQKCIEDVPFDALGGKIDPVFPENTPDWVKNNLDILCGPVVFHNYGEDVMLYKKSMKEFVGANIIFKRSVFDDCGLFRTDLGAGTGTMGEDTEFFKRLIQKSKKIYYNGSVVVNHPVELDRVGLKYLARWNKQIAKYRFMHDEQGCIDSSLVYYFGIPRYLIKNIIVTSISLLFKVFNRRSFLMAWIRLSQDLGRMEVIREKYYDSKN